MKKGVMMQPWENSLTEGAHQPHKSGSAGYRGITLALFAAGLTTFMSMYSAQAVLPALSHAFHVSPSTAALSVSLTTGFLAFSLIPAGMLSERYGRTRIMAFSAIASSIVGLIIPFSTSIEMMLVGRALQGIVLAGVPAVAMAYLAEEIHSDALGRAMGRYVAGTTLGGLSGRLIPSVALEIMPWQLALETASVISLFFTVLFLRLLPPSRFFQPAIMSVGSLTSGLLSHCRNSTLRCLFALGFILMGGFVTVYNYLGYRLVSTPFSLPHSVAGLVFVLYLSGTFSSAQAGRIADRRGRATVLTSGIVLMGVGLVATIPDSLWAVVIGILLFTAGFFAAHTTASGWVSRTATHHRAGASSLYLFSYYLGSSVLGECGGFAFSHSGWSGLSIFVGFPLLLALGLASLLARSSRLRG